MTRPLLYLALGVLLAALALALLALATLDEWAPASQPAPSPSIVWEA